MINLEDLEKKINYSKTLVRFSNKKRNNPKIVLNKAKNKENQFD